MTPRTISVVTAQLQGYDRNGGVGTATAFLAVGLARCGHRVRILYSGTPPERPLEREWADLYARARISVAIVPERTERVTPQAFSRARDVELTLREERSDVVVAHDFGAHVYTALRLRQLGLAFEDTLFLIYCHGTQRFAKHGRTARLSEHMLTVNLLEQASLELADAIVSPSRFLLEWMRDQQWMLPDRREVIPHLTRSSALGQAVSEPKAHDGRVRRLAFFGRLEEIKGLRPLAAALNRLDPTLLNGVELEFLGRPTKGWSEGDVAGLLSPSTHAALAAVSFQTVLDQNEALARLARPGTLAVMPSFLENSPNTVYECLDHGIPFIASAVGGIPELIAEADRPRVLFEPTADGVEGAIRLALADGRRALRPAQRGFDATASLGAWDRLVSTPARSRVPDAEQPAVDVVVAHRTSQPTLARCLRAVSMQTYGNVRLTVASSLPDEMKTHRGDLPRQPAIHRRDEGNEAVQAPAVAVGSAEWVLVLDEDDEPYPALLAALDRARAASGADAVTCGLAVQEESGAVGEHLFLGEPRGLGVVANGYGTVALVRRSLLAEASHRWPPEMDTGWPLLAQLSAHGAHIVSVPLPLVTTTRLPGTLARAPGDALLALEHLERALPGPQKSLARLAAGLRVERRSGPLPPGSARRTAQILRRDGVAELARQVARRLRGISLPVPLLSSRER